MCDIIYSFRENVSRILMCYIIPMVVVLIFWCVVSDPQQLSFDFNPIWSGMHATIKQIRNPIGDDR